MKMTMRRINRREWEKEDDDQRRGGEEVRNLSSNKWHLLDKITSKEGEIRLSGNYKRRKKKVNNKKKQDK